MWKGSLQEGLLLGLYHQYTDFVYDEMKKIYGILN